MSGYMDARFSDVQTFLGSSQVSQTNTVNDEKYKAEFKAGTYSMTEDQYVSLRRVDDGLEQLVPGSASTQQPVTPLALNPLASGL